MSKISLQQNLHFSTFSPHLQAEETQSEDQSIDQYEVQQHPVAQNLSHFIKIYKLEHTCRANSECPPGMFLMILEKIKGYSDVFAPKFDWVF